MPFHADLRLPLLAALTTAFLVGCDFPGGTNPPGPPPLQTQFVEVRVEPTPVAVGDTATFTAIIDDSLDTRFRFTWFIPSQTQVTTETNELRWPATLAPGVYDAIVGADNGSPDSLSPSKGFTIEVVR